MERTWQASEESAVVGKVVFEVPKWTERMKYVKECKFTIDSEGNVEAGADQIDSLIKMVELATPHIKTVDLKTKEGSSVFKSFDDLQSDPICDAVLVEIASAVINGAAVGKN
jgi:hypothetical protein